MPKKIKMSFAAETENKLAMVPAHGLAVAAPNALFTLASELPKNLKKLTLPPMIKPETVPMGSVVSGVIVGLAASISGRADMRESKLIHLRHASGEEFLFPLTGVIKRAIGGNDGVTKNIGKQLFLKRTADGETEKYGGKKKVYMFDVYLAD